MTNNKGKIFTIILISFLIASIFGVGGYWLGKNQTAIKKSSNSIELDAMIQSLGTQSIEIPSDWKIYTDEKYGFSFKYPENLIDMRSGPYANWYGKNSRILLQKSGDLETLISVEVYDKVNDLPTADNSIPNEPTLGDYLAIEKAKNEREAGNQQFSEISGFEKVSIDNIDWYYVNETDIGGADIYYTEKNGVIIKIRNSSMVSSFQILSSFQFK